VSSSIYHHELEISSILFESSSGVAVEMQIELFRVFGPLVRDFSSLIFTDSCNVAD
jgi:hypothetical protein